MNILDIYLKTKELPNLTTLYTLRHLKQYMHQIKPNINFNDLNSENRIFFLDTPSYSNLGDQAICLGMKEYIKDILPKYKTFEIQDNQFPSSIKWLKDNIRNTDIICLTGGGNMGTRYRLSEAIRRIVIKTFSKNLIIIFPQTFDYIETKYDQKERNNAIKTYSKARKLIVTAREMKSYNSMISDYKFASVLCIPDMALY